LCPVCFWEDDPDQRHRPWSRLGANGLNLAEGQKNYIACGAMHPDFLRKVRPPRLDEPRDPAWRPYEPTDRELELAVEEEAEWNAAAERAIAASDVEGPFREFNVGMGELRAQAPNLGYAEVESRLRGLTRSHGVPFGDAEIELFARCLRDHHWPLKHPAQALSWVWRHRHTTSVRQRLDQLRTRSVHFAG
jgi:Cysteine-rich CPCC